MEYNFAETEARWKQYWAENKVYKVTNDATKPKYYVLDMFPYPSGAGLHVGHPLGYIASDIYSRYKRLRGFNVLHPMGFDAFGLPAEQYALETGRHPAVTTEINIARYREQLDNIGFCFDWDRAVKTSDPQYYKWTQWIFLQLFHSWYNRAMNKARPLTELTAVFEQEGNINTPCPADEKMSFNAKAWQQYSDKQKRDVLMKYRLAYQGYAQVWWCEALGTVLANDEVVNGVSERGGHPVERKNMRQWFLRITEYADRLLTSLDTLEWSDAMKEMQRNWIGKSDGAIVKFNISYNQVAVFTTRPDTLFGVDFLVLAPEHELVGTITTEAQAQAVEDYKTYVKSRSERERQAEVKQVTGCFTGAYAAHPLTNRLIPVWISEYVLAGYGTGAIMGVPSGDDRDHRFAKHFKLEITNIFGEQYNGENAFSQKTGTIHNSGFITGLSISDAAEAVISTLEKLDAGNRKVNYRLRDAGFSRQRYWGEPFPVVYINDEPYAIDETPLDNTQLNQLPVELPMIEHYTPGPEGQGPLANLRDWVDVSASPLTPLHKWRGEPLPEDASRLQGNSAQATATPLVEREPGGEAFQGDVPKYSVKLPHPFETARRRREEVTEAEHELWQHLRNGKMGVKFRREHPVDAYIADFICLQKSLIIEVDGDYHFDSVQKELDEERTKILNDIGFEVIRFANEEVLTRIDTVINKITMAIASRVETAQQLQKDSPGVTPSPLVERGPGGEVLLRETNTMPGYAGSSWYFLRYMDPHNDNEFAGRAATDYWRQVDLYVGGTEHAVGHLLYSRMWTKALYDLGHIGFDEPFKKLLNQGMIQGSSRFVYRVNDTNQFVSAGLRKDYEVTPIHVDVSIVDGLELNTELFKKWRQDYAGATFILEDGKYICGAEVEKMSKRYHNVVNPDDIVRQYGADTFRMYEMFLGPVEISKPWDTKGIEGVHRFLKKLWRLYVDEQKGWQVTDEPATDAQLRLLHKTIKKIGEDIERFSFNTSVSQFMICVNELTALNCHKRAILAPLAVIICPFAPHLAEELWQRLGEDGSAINAQFPAYEQQYVTENTKKYPVAINGKPRVEMEFPLDAEKAAVEAEVLANETIQKWLEGKTPKNFIYVKGKMINVVI